MINRKKAARFGAAAAVTLAGCVAGITSTASASHDDAFRRIATFPIFENTSIENETVAEIVAATADGKTLIYTDSELEALGFVDITDPANPVAGGIVELAGEPTSVTVKGNYALACINTSEDFINTSGRLVIVDITTREIVREIELGGQPDAIAISPWGRYAAICIENERDEDLGDGEPPQLPAGFLVIVDTPGNNPDAWSTRDVDLTGIADLYPEDPEPEFVDINRWNVAAVTLQENNHVVLVNLRNGRVITDFAAGTVDLDGVDIAEEDVIDQSGVLLDVPREPDAITWIGNFALGTADEGDLFGGSRGFTTFFKWGGALFEAGTDLEDATTRLGHYPEGRSENKGNEPESIEYARYGWDKYLFVGSERSSVVFVYEIEGFSLFGAFNPRFRQTLPTGVAPEGLLAIPGRDLLVVACEDDARDDKIRASIMIYELGNESAYPTVQSADNDLGKPIPWGALSALDMAGPGRAVTVHDSFYKRNRVLTMDLTSTPAVIDGEIEINDTTGVLLTALQNLKAELPGTDDFDPAAIVNGDGSVNIDPEGIAAMPDGSVWVASEGRGNLVDGISDPGNRPFESPNMLIKVEASGAVSDVILPPTSVTRNQLRFGFEGVERVMTDGGPRLAVTWQRAWTAAGDLNGQQVRLALVNPATGDWTFAYYPLDGVESANGGWVGNSDLAWRNGVLYVQERDNQGGPDAAIKRLYAVELDASQFVADSEDPQADFTVLSKTLVRDHLAAGDFDASAGFTPEKIEGLLVMPNGDIWIVNDNDGVDDNSGETLLLNVGNLDD